MNLTLIKYTPEPEKTIATAARLCYSPISGNKIYKNMSLEEARKLIKFIVKSGHLSPIEHASFTFSVEGISRVLSHQIVRNRIASYSQQSQRYVKFYKNFDFIIPPIIQKDTNLTKAYSKFMKKAHNFYLNLLYFKIPAEDARYVLPNASETKMIFTMNAREILHFVTINSCNRSQWEMVDFSDKILFQVKKVAPSLFEKAGPNCVRNVCTETKFKCKNPKTNYYEE